LTGSCGHISDGRSFLDSPINLSDWGCFLMYLYFVLLKLRKWRGGCFGSGWDGVRCSFDGYWGHGNGASIAAARERHSRVMQMGCSGASLKQSNRTFPKLSLMFMDSVSKARGSFAGAVSRPITNQAVTSLLSYAMMNRGPRSDSQKTKVDRKPVMMLPILKMRITQITYMLPSPHASTLDTQRYPHKANTPNAARPSTPATAVALAAPAVDAVSGFADVAEAADVPDVTVPLLVWDPLAAEDAPEVDAAAAAVVPDPDAELPDALAALDAEALALEALALALEMAAATLVALPVALAVERALEGDAVAAPRLTCEVLYATVLVESRTK